MDYCNSCSYKIREDFEKKSSSIDGEKAYGKGEV